MKKILILLTTLSMFALVGCTSNESEDKPSGETNDTTLNDAYEQLTIQGDLSNVYGNLNLVTSIGEVVVAWETSDSTVITKDGVINITDTDKTAELTATLSYDNNTKQKKFEIVVKGDGTVYDTIADALVSTSNSTVTIKAVVSKLRGNDFFIQDSTGGIFVYCNSSNKGVAEGDVIKLVGVIGSYGNAVQITPTTVDVLSSGSKINVNPISDLSDDTLNANMYNIVSLENVNIDSIGTYNQANDFNFQVSVSANQVSVHVNKRNSDADKASIATVLSLLSSDNVINLNNVVISQYNGVKQILVCSGNDLEEANVETSVKIERIKSDISNLTDLNGKTITSNLKLVTSSLYSSTITWSSNNSAISNTGIVTRPNEGEDDISVTLTYTVSVDGQTFNGTINVVVAAKTPAGDLLPYYDDAAGLEGSALEYALKTIISTGVISLSYSNIWTTCEEANEDPNNSNNVILFYSGFSVDKDDHVSGSTGWNREHTWPQSKDGPYTDAHHLMPTDNRTNSVRGNNPFAVGGSYVTSGYGTVTTSKSTGSTFEPRDEVKGDVARICMYIAVRYGFDINTVISLDLALEWNEFDPVDDFEINRNNVLYGYQNNRNPFIDNPEFANMIWG